MPQILNLEQANLAFDILNTNQSRLYLTLNMIIFKNSSLSFSMQTLKEEIKDFSRKTDILFEISNDHFGILLIESSSTEATALCNRLFSRPIFQEESTHVVACTLDIRQEQLIFQEIIQVGLSALEQQHPARTILPIGNFCDIPLTTIKVSIIVSEYLFAQALQHALSSLSIEH